MNLQIETVTTMMGKMDVIRDIEKVRRIIATAERAIDLLRFSGHKHGGAFKCQLCDALKEWERLKLP